MHLTMGHLTKGGSGSPVSTDTGWVDAGAGGPSGWSDENNITAEDGVVAASGTVNETDELRGEQYGISLPSGATIDGIEVRCKAKEITREFTYDLVQLYWNGISRGTSQEAGEELTTGLAFTTFGGSSNTWGASPTKADVERSDFGVSVRFQAPGEQEGSVEVDCLQIKVHYTYTP